MDLQDLLQHIYPGAQASFIEFWQHHHENRHVKVLAAAVRKNPHSLRALYDYGLAALEDRQDQQDLGPYFFLLSELTLLPPRARDFALDLSLFCDDPEIAPIRDTDIAERYRSGVEPLLG